MSDVSMIDGHIDETKLKDEDIIKALECCVKDILVCDTKCPLIDSSDREKSNCRATLFKNALELINRKDEQINSLIAGQETLQKHLAEKNAEIDRLKRIGKSTERKGE